MNSGERDVRSPIWWSVAGVVLLSVWVGGWAYTFWTMVGAVQGGLSAETLRDLSWPFVVVLVAVPTLAILLIGGLRMLGQVLALRELLDGLPGQIESMEQLATRTAQSNSLIETSKRAMSDAAGVLDQALGQLADFEARIARLKVSSDGGSLEVTTTASDAVTALAGHLERARRLFAKAAKRAFDQSGLEVERAKGWILESSVNQLRDLQFMPADEAKYVSLALDIDRRTRRAGRANLKQGDIDRLNEIKPAVDEDDDSN